MSRKLIVEIVGDSSSLEKAFKKSAKDTKKFSAEISGIGNTATRAFGGVAAALGVGLGLDKLVDGLRSSVNAASDLQEQVGKVDVVFGASAKQIEEWSKTTATAFGLSQRQALATAGSFGALFAPLGIAGETAAEQSRKLTELGADLASFYNTDVQSALDAIRSGLVGESEPLRNYGVQLSEARVQAEAMAESGKKSASSLTNQEKALARIKIIFEDTAKAQGNFHDTSDGLANQLRILTAQTDDLKASLGQALLPAITNVVTQFNDWLADPENKQKIIDGFTTSVEKLGDAAQTTATDIQKIVGAFEDLRKKRNDVKNWDKKGPSGLDIFKGIYDIYKEPVKGILGDLGLYSPGRAGLKVPGMRSKDFDVSSLLPGAGTDGGVAQAVKDAFKTTTKDRGVATKLAEQRNKWFDAMIGRELDRVQDIPTLKAQTVRLKEIAALIQQRIAVTKDVTRQLTLKDTLAGVLRQMKDNDTEIADNAKAAADAAKQRAIDVATLAVARAEATPGLEDNLRTERHLVAVLKQQLAADKKNVDLQNQLFSAEQDVKNTLDERKMTAVQIAAARAEFTPSLTDNLKAARDVLAVLRAQGATALEIIAQQKVIRDLENQQTQNVAQIAVARAELTPYLSDNLAAARKFLEALKKEHATALEILVQQKVVQDLEKEQTKQMAERAKTAREKKQFLALGLTGEGLDRAPGVKALKAQAQKLTKALEGTILDTKKNRGILDGIRKVLSGKLGAIGREMRLRIKQMIDDLNQQAQGVGKKKRKMIGGIYVDKYGNAIGPGLPNQVNFVDPYTSAMNKFTGAVTDATEALGTLDKLRIFADLRQFGGNLWSRAGVATLGGLAGGGSPTSRLENMPRIQWGGGRRMPLPFTGSGGLHPFGGGGTVVVNQHFNAPTTDRHREARYALMATRSVFDS